MKVQRRKMLVIDFVKGHFVTFLLGAFLGFYATFLSLLSNTNYSRIGDTASLNLNFSNDEEASEIPEKKNIPELLKEKIRVYCWILTGKSNHEKRAIHVKNTWCRRCEKCVFMSSVADPNIPTIGLEGVSEGHDRLWGKTRAAFKYIYDNENISNYDWFLKADDDTYVIMENLRYMLLPHSPEEPIYLGCRLLVSNTKDYNSGGAGYVLSRTALYKLATEALPNRQKCRDGELGFEDDEMGKCLRNVGVKLGDTRDSDGRYRFLPHDPSRFIDYDPSFLFYTFNYYPMKKGFDCCSDYPISFHYLTVKDMYNFEYLLYNAKVFGESPSANVTAESFLENALVSARDKMGPDDELRGSDRKGIKYDARRRTVLGAANQTMFAKYKRRKAIRTTKATPAQAAAKTAK